VKSRGSLFRKCLLFAIALALPLINARTSAGSPPKAPRSLRLYIFDCGIIQGLNPALFNFKKEELATTDLAVPCYLVVHPKGTLIWDTGIIPDSAFKGDGKPVTQGSSTATKSLISQLGDIGYTPKDITYLALSHYHVDHAANANEFAASTWLVQKADHDAMFAEKPPRLARIADYVALKDSKTVVITTEDYDVFHDGSVIIKAAPGHTPGHQVLFLKLKETGPVLIAGDMYHYPEERTLNRTPTIDVDQQQNLISRVKIEAFVKQAKAQLWIEHDYAANQKLKKSPEFYK